MLKDMQGSVQDHHNASPMQSYIHDHHDYINDIKRRKAYIEDAIREFKLAQEHIAFAD